MDNNEYWTHLEDKLEQKIPEHIKNTLKYIE